MTIVVKVGGSLYDMPDLGPRLRRFLRNLAASRVVIVPGGGPAADVVRQWDALHHLGEEAAHWLALYAMSLNAHLLASLLPGARIVADADAASGNTCIVDGYAFARQDDGHPRSLPHCWGATSDSLAVRVALTFAARRLILLKSTAFPQDLTWEEATRRGILDRHFTIAARQAPQVEIQLINFREL